MTSAGAPAASRAPSASSRARAEPSGRGIGEEQGVAEADLLLAATEVEAGQLTGLYGADPARVAVVHPGVDTEMFHPAAAEPDRAALGIGDGDIVVAFAGRIQPHKGPAVLVRAAAELRRRYPARTLRVLIVGDASGDGQAEPRRLRALATGLGVAAVVRLIPALPAAELARVFRAADVVAVPSYSEAFGLVAVEAQA